MHHESGCGRSQQCLIDFFMQVQKITKLAYFYSEAYNFSTHFIGWNRKFIVMSFCKKGSNPESFFPCMANKRFSLSHCSKMISFPPHIDAYRGKGCSLHTKKQRTELEDTSEDRVVQCPYLTQWSARTGCPDQVHLGFEYPQEWRFHSLSEQPLLLLDHLHRRKISYVKTYFLVFLSVAIAFCPFTGVRLTAI